jgi:uncharacterized protein (DUF2062 family)
MAEEITKAEQPGFIRRRVVEPVIQLLRMGMTPQRLAWSIAVGAVIGINPLLGSTTVLVLAVASAFRLNLVASQIGNHVVYPLELLLFPVFLRVGIVLFHSPGLPLEREALFRAIKQHPWDTTRLLWRWEWHAFLVWLALAVILAPLLQLSLRPVLERMLVKLHNEPVVKT